MGSTFSPAKDIHPKAFSKLFFKFKVDIFLGYQKKYCQILALVIIFFHFYIRTSENINIYIIGLSLKFYLTKERFEVGMVLVRQQKLFFFAQVSSKTQNYFRNCLVK